MPSKQEDFPLMNIVTEINEWIEIRKTLSEKTIGLVHTMGNLHAGHLSLLERSKRENEVTAAAIFINPAQFNQAEDFARYPRTLVQDKALLLQHGIDYLLLFEANALYSDHYQIQILETEISKELEGEFRPGHFTGMLTIVLKFLNLVRPSRSYYGEKDFQQLLLIQKMAKALFLSTEIIACPIIRDEDEVALSSRNSRLSKEERAHARHIPRLLKSPLSLDEIRREFETLHFKVDYIVEKWQRRLAAVWLNEVRLIDNIEWRK
jgi:pantoate--beta-alanine ligase